MEEIKSPEHNPASLNELADTIAETHKDIPDIVVAIRHVILDHAHTLSDPYEPKSIIESRFTPAQEAFEKGMLSCGAMVNIATSMLRHLGYEIKLVHGESVDSVDHAWIAVRNSESNEWDQYDLTEDDARVPSTNIVKSMVDSWDDIRDEIIEDDKTLKERKKARGL